MRCNGGGGSDTAKYPESSICFAAQNLFTTNYIYTYIILWLYHKFEKCLKPKIVLPAQTYGKNSKSISINFLSHWKIIIIFQRSGKTYMLMAKLYESVFSYFVFIKKKLIYIFFERARTKNILNNKFERNNNSTLFIHTYIWKISEYGQQQLCILYIKYCTRGYPSASHCTTKRLA